MSAAKEIIGRALAVHFVFPPDPAPKTNGEMREYVERLADYVERMLNGHGFVIVESQDLGP